jgi:NADH-quinone oxidoreductase subunit M
MAPDRTFPLLTVLVFLPALGGLVVAIAGRTRAALVPWLAVLFASVTLVLAIGALEGGFSELATWVPSLGVSFLLGSDELSSVLVAWVALATLVTLIGTLPSWRSAALVLGLETAVNGLFLAQDVFLMFAFLGGVTVVVALLSSAPQKVLVFAVLGLGVLFSWFVRFYQTAYVQTGFPSTELARWRSLVLYPEDERSLFLLGACGMALLVPAFAVALENAPRAHRLVLFATLGVVGSYLVVRLLVPLCPRGAEASASWVLAFAVLLMASAGLARGFSLVAVGYHGLVLFGLFSFRESAVVGAEVLMVAAAIGFFGLELATSRRLIAYFVSFLMGMPIAFILVPLWGSGALWASLAFSMMAYRFVTLAKTSFPAVDVEHVQRRQFLSAAMVVLSASMIVGWGAWAARVRPSAIEFVHASARKSAEP